MPIICSPFPTLFVPASRTACVTQLFGFLLIISLVRHSTVAPPHTVLVAFTPSYLFRLPASPLAILLPYTHTFTVGGGGRGNSGAERSINAGGGGSSGVDRSLLLETIIGGGRSLTGECGIGADGITGGIVVLISMSAGISFGGGGSNVGDTSRGNCGSIC